jgi:hypothetical protein
MSLRRLNNKVLQPICVARYQFPYEVASVHFFGAGAGTVRLQSAGAGSGGSITKAENHLIKANLRFKQIEPPHYNTVRQHQSLGY